jgi:ABC-type branched-subunit amino acid transport system permease subunit
MKRHLRNGLNAGIVFAVVTVFLFVVGFTTTIADIIGTLLHNHSANLGSALTPAMLNLLIFFFFIGVWAGARGARKTPGETDSWGAALLAGGLAGLVHGVFVACLGWLLGTLAAAHVLMTFYFAQLLPDTVRTFLIGMAPLPGALFYLVFFLLTGVLGGVVARGVGRGAWREGFSAWLKIQWKKVIGWGVITFIKNNKVARYILFGVIILFFFLLPLMVGQYWNYTLGTVGIYVLLGLGLNIVVGMAGLLDLGYVAFFAIGGYTVALLTAPAPQHLMWNFWVTIPIAIVLAAFAGVVLGIPVLRLRGDYLAIVTLGFGQIIAVLLKSDELTNFTGGPKGVTAVGAPTLFGHPFSDPAAFVYLILLAVILVIVVTIRLRSSRVGRAWEAMREDETVARAMGINTLTTKLLAFAIGAAFAGLGGVIFASRNQFTGPEDYNLMVSFNVIASVIVGGMGSLPGVVGGAFALKGLPEVLRELENYRVLAFGALLVVMMLIRPAGLIPTSRRKMESGKTPDAEPDPLPDRKKGKSS